MLGHRVPGHFGPLGNGAIIRLVWVNLHILPDLPLLLGKFLRRGDPSQSVQDCLPLGIQLLDEHLQLLLTLFTGMSIDAFGVLGAIWPGGRVAALEEVVVDLGDAASSRLAGAPHNRLEVGERILRRLRRVFRHLIAQATVDFCSGFVEHIAGDVGVDIQCCSRRHVAQHGGEGLDVHAIFQCHGGKGMTQIVKSDLLAPSPLQNDMEPPEHGTGCERHIQILWGWKQPPGLCRLSVFPEHLHHSRRQHQFADRGFCLGDTQLHLSIYLIDLFGYGQRSGIQIQVGPL